MSAPTPEEQVRFLANIQRILEEGSFVSTYKFALLIALADISVEDGDNSGDPLAISTRRIASKFVEFYWRQGRPWITAAINTDSAVLFQNAGRQAKVVSLVCEARDKGYDAPVASRVRRAEEKGLLGEVARTTEIMPLWKLQIMGREVVPFLYENRGTGREIVLKPGVAFCFRSFHGLVRQLAQGAWTRFVRELRGNRGLIGDTADLADFLFGAQRAALDEYRPVLREVQSGACFYCGRELKGKSEVDHFVPWSRYPLDLGHNFVLGCRACNNGKRDFLAGERYLDRWAERNDRAGDLLGEYFDGKRLTHNLARSVQVARWAYSQAESAGANVWAGKDGRNDRFERLGAGWRSVFG
ncbi:MAG: HNH endonuclease [Pirellulales bacterium]|nr:HNH endonuclease [Pirellulales bacterium]